MTGSDARSRPAQPAQPGQPIVPSAPITPGQPAAQGLPQARPVPLAASSQPVPQAQPIAQPAPSPTIPQAQPVPVGQTTPGVARPVIIPRQPGTTAVRSREEDEEPQEELSTFALRHSPPWLVSTVVHMLLMIILALNLLSGPSKPTIELETVWAEDIGDQLEYDSPLAGNDEDMVEEPMLTPEDLMLVDDPFAAPPDVQIVPDGFNATSDMQATQIGMALDGREEGTRQSLLGAYGGTEATQAAVESGLRWLAKNQDSKTGAWSLVGPYGGGVPADYENLSAATAMALIAFQGNGNTPTRGDFKKNVAVAWEWMINEQDSNGNFYHEGPHNHRYYTQGMCTIAACELYGMTKDEQYRELAEKALQYCLDGQSDMGGWKYRPGPDSGSDLSVTGWILMAMQSARMAGLEVPADHFRRAEKFLDRIQEDNGSRYPYERHQEASLTMTAEGLLCRQYLGWKRDDERLVNGVAWITEPANLVNYDQGRDVYYWYYATQVAHHMEGEYWKRWNDVMRQEVPQHQTKEGREAGSWDPKRPTEDEWQRFGGRLYVTCLSIYMLEVYYRHLPIYSGVYGIGGSI